MMVSINDDSSNQETQFNHMELKNWEQGYEAYDQGFGPLTRQTIPTLLESADFPPVTASEDRAEVRLLDVATGPGFVLTAAIDSVSTNKRQQQTTYHLTGLDITQNFLSLAKQRIDTQLNHGLQMKVDFIKGSAESLPFPDNTFDSITCNFGILHFFKPKVFLHESFRCLRPGGKVSFSCWAPPTRTEGFQIALQSIAEVGNPNVDGLPEGPNFFDFGDSEQAMYVLNEVGFEDTKVIELSEMKWNNVKNGTMLYDVLLQGTSRSREILLGQTAEESVAIKSLMDKKYDTITNGGKRPLAMPAVVSSGQKPF